MRIQNANNLKPAANEISHIQTLTADKKVMQWSVYLLDGKYNLVKGMIFHERQNHDVFMSNKSYNVIANYLINAE
jgi:hypothetical protein